MPTSSESDGVAIRCEGIGKRYRIGRTRTYRTLRETITDAVRAPFRSLADKAGETDLWAVRDLSFEVHPGEVVGIIGRNGSGKSTLLKILSRITKPTEGSAAIHGRMGTLLEVGAGFHPELTGRENIYLNGAILGMTRAEITRKFEEIVEFSECVRMLDTPMKHYSSGMYVRLAFAVAAHLETEILLVDEVLAVGDAVFQKKCLGKMNDVAHQGRTVLFVSHNMPAIDGLCTRALCLHDGNLVLEGPPALVTSTYLQTWLPKFREVVYNDFEAAPGTELIRLHRAYARPVSATSEDRITVRTPFSVELEYWKTAAHTEFEFKVIVTNEHGITVFMTSSLGTPNTPQGLVRSGFLIPGDLLNNGTYRVMVVVFLGGTTYVTEWEDLITFEVFDAASELRGANHEQWPGAVRPHFEWNAELIGELPMKHV